jgi:hypothetical protein
MDAQPLPAGARPVPASLVAFGATPTHAIAQVLEQGASRRAARALAGLAGCWGAAAVAVFIPVAHFVLVPTFVLSGVVLAVVRLREASRLVGLRGVCPRCGAEQDFDVSGRFEAERPIDCPRCHTHLRLVSAPAR